MPTGNTAGPVSGVAVDFFSELKKPILAGPIIKPVNAGEVIAGPLLLPERLQKILIRDGHLPPEVPAHQLKHPAIAGLFIL